MPTSSPIDWESFNHLGECTGSTLSSFEDVPVLETDPFKFASPAVFKLFPQMRFFGWDSPISFKLQGEPIPPDTFNNLVQLTVDEFHSSFLEVLAQMECVDILQVNFNFSVFNTPQITCSACRRFLSDGGGRG
jgi:hypothetical protein